MAKIERKQDLPEWYDLKKYQQADTFGAADWYTQLAYRKELLICNPWFPDLWAEHHAQEVAYNAEVWRHRIAKLAPPLRESPILCTEWESAYLGAPEQQPVSNLTVNDLRNIAHIDRLKSKRNSGPTILDHIATPIDKNLPEAVRGRTLELECLYPVATTKAALLVDLSASDSTLEASFRAWLKETRARESSATAKRAKPFYARWASYGVLPYLDLLMWAMETETHIPRHVMADAVGYVKGESSFSKTVVPLAADLMRDLSELRAQAAVEAAICEASDSETFEC